MRSRPIRQRVFGDGVRHSYDTPTIPGTGLTVSSRGNQLDSKPSERGGARQAAAADTAPAMAFRDGKFFMAWGTPGGDVQMQAMLQVFLNVSEFGMRVQEAIEKPSFANCHFSRTHSHPTPISPDGSIPRSEHAAQAPWRKKCATADTTWKVWPRTSIRERRAYAR